MDLSSSHHHLQAIWTKRSQVSMHREVIHLHHPSGAPLNGCETFQQTFQLAPEHHTEPSLNLVQEFSFVVSYSRATLLKSCMWAEEGWHYVRSMRAGSTCHLLLQHTLWECIRALRPVENHFHLIMVWCAQFMVRQMGEHTLKGWTVAQWSESKMFLIGTQWLAKPWRQPRDSYIKTCPWLYSASLCASFDILSTIESNSHKGDIPEWWFTPNRKLWLIYAHSKWAAF